MARNQIFATSVALLLLASSTAWAMSCSWDSKTGATFNLGPLQKTTPYVITDGDIPCTPTVEQNYTYYFDVCQDVPKTNSFITECPKSGPSLQVDHSRAEDCFSAGKLSEATWSLIDDTTPDPSKGVKLTYSGGDVCNRNNFPRRTTLFFECTNDAMPNPTTAYEVSHCDYQIHMRSYYGCPLECPIAGRQLCGGKGMCAYDNLASKARCFCYEGYTGADCTEAVEEPSSSGFNGAVIGLLLTVFLISLVLVGALFVLVKQVRSYRQDATNYMQIHGEELMPTSSSRDSI